MDSCFDIWSLFLKRPDARSKSLLVDTSYNADPDIIKLKEMMVRRQYFREEDVNIIAGANASTSSIRSELDSLLKFAKSTNQKTIILLVLSGQTVGIPGSDHKDPSISQAFVTSDGILSKYDLFDNFVQKLPSTCNIFIMVNSYYDKPFSELKYRYNCDMKNTYTIINDHIPTDCNCVILNGCQYDDYLMKLLSSGDNKQSRSDTLKAFMDIYNENISIRNLVLGIKQWFHRNNSNQIPHISSSKLVPIKLTLGSMFRTDLE